MIDLVNYALSFEFIINAYIPFLVKSFFGLGAFAFIVLLFVVLYSVFESTKFGDVILFFISILLILSSILISIVLLLILGLPILLSIISIKIYLINIFPNTPLLINAISAFVVVALIATIVQIIKNNIL